MEWGGGKSDAKEWYFKRAKRIYIPYEIFVIGLFLIHAIQGRELRDMDWLWLALGLQGSNVGVLGAEQTWFITPLLLCYVITPLLHRFITKDITKEKAILIVCIAAGSKLLWAIPKSPAYNTILSLVSYYSIAFVVGRYFDRLTFTRGRAGGFFLLMCLAFGIRLVGRALFDGTVLYERVICGYTQSIAAFCIFYLFAVVFQDSQPLKWVQFISEISFEIYLVHYMFCVGPVRLFGLTPSWMLDCLIVTVGSVVLAMILHVASCSISKKLR